MRIESKRHLAALLVCVIAGVFAMTLAGCGDSPQEKQAKQFEEEEKANFSDEPAPVQVHTGYSSGYHVKEPTVVIARNDAQLNDLKKKQFSNGVKREDIAPVQFDGEYQVVAVFLPRSPAGTNLTITDVYEEDGLVHVKAVRLLPGKGCPTKGEKPYPFHWVQTRQMPGNAQLDLTSQRSPSC